MIPTFYNISPESLSEQLRAWNQPSFRAKQIWQGVYHDLAASFENITTLPLPLREQLAATYAMPSLRVQTEVRSHDGSTHKFLFAAPDGKTFETVLMRYDERNTVCCSTQVGCAMGCSFCATGQMGFFRNLSAGEIVEQVMFCARLCREWGEELSNVVVMGMGEPFHNYDAVMEALYRLQDPNGFRFSPRRVTISTVGILPAMRRYTEEGHPFQLALSLHAATDSMRARLIPVAKRYLLADLMEACRAYTNASHRRITLEWALIHDENDTPEQAQNLCALLRGMNCHVNLIQLNPTRGYAGSATTRERAEAFQEVLQSAGIPCTIRLRRGVEIAAGCGQLAS